MRIPRLSTRATFVAVVALLAAAVGGAAWAAIPNADGSLDGCYNNRTGLLRVIDRTAQSCTAAESGITFASMSEGKVADSDRLDGRDSSELVTRAQWDRAGNASASIDAEFPAWTTVANATLPAGRHVVFARANVYQSASVENSLVQVPSIMCELRAGGAQLDLIELNPAHPSGTFGWPTDARSGVSLQGATASSSGSIPLELRCTKMMPGSQTLVVRRPSFVSLSAGALHLTQLP